MAAQYDTSITAGLDSSQVEAGAKAMEKDMSAFAKSAEQGFTKVSVAQTKVERGYKSMGIAAEQFSTRQLGAMRAAAATGPGGSEAAAAGKGGYRAGQVAMQAQDIAVQMQMGAKATTIIAQQGSQIASIFGPRGAIYGGVIAITAAFVEQVSGIKKLEQEVEKLEKKFGEGQAADASAIGVGQSAEKDARVMRAKRIAGEEAAERLKIKLDTQAQIEKIEASDASEGVKKDNIAKIKALEEERYAEIDEKNKKSFAEWNAQSDAMISQSKRLNAEISETPVERVQFLAQAYRDAIDARDKIANSGNTEGFAKAELDATRAKVALVKELGAQAKEAIQTGNEQERQRERAKTDMERFLHGARELTALAQKGLKGLFDQFGLEAQSKELAKQVAMSRELMGARIAKAGDALLDPSAAKAARQMEKREKIADRTAAEREVDKFDRQNGGLPGHHHLSQTERARAIGERRTAAFEHRHPKQEFHIAKEDLNELATKIAAENAKLIAK